MSTPHMTTHSKNIPLVLMAALLGGPAIITPLHAASLGFVSETQLSKDSAFKLSVYPAKASYSGLATGNFGDGTVEAYRFWRNGGTDGDGVETYANDGSGVLSEITHSVNPPPNSLDLADVWTSNNPGSSFSGGDAANFGGTTLTISGAYNVKGTVDVSNFLSGTLYVLAGAWGNTIKVDASMTGTGQTTLSAINGALRTTAASANRNTYVFAYMFDNSDKLYSQITYSFLSSGENANNRSRFMGVVVDAVRPPGAVPISPIGNAIVTGPSTNLLWTNDTPNTGGDVWSDVWHGTDPSALTKVLHASTSAANLTTTSVPITVAGTHYWRVDNYLAGSPTGSPVIGPVVSFVVNDSDGDGLPDSYELLHTGTPQGMKTGDDLENAGAGDGLTNLQEFNLGTNPTLVDTDGDGLNDGPETIGVGSRPATNPILADTDGDGSNDGNESNTGTWTNASNAGTNPVNPDTDADGLKDGAENNTGTFVDKNATGTSPLNPDKDSDGVGDWYEVAASFTNPNIASDKPKVPYPLPDPDSSTGATNKPVKVYIMAGQSNMVGMGNVSGTQPGTLETITGKEHKFPNLVGESGWLARKDVRCRGVISATGKDDLKPGFGAGSNKIGPELGFGQIMGWYHDEPVLLIKASDGNRALGFDFLPPGSPRVEWADGKTYAGYGDPWRSFTTGGSPTVATWYAGKQYDDCFLADADMAPAAWADATAYPASGYAKSNGVTYQCTAAHTSSPNTQPGVGASWQTKWKVHTIFNVADILDGFAAEYPDDAGQGFEIAGFVWWQGHRDQSNAPYIKLYEKNMVRFINQIRAYYEARYPKKGAAAAPFVIATIGFNGGPYTPGSAYADIWQAQTNVGNPNLYPSLKTKTIDALPYWRAASESPTNEDYHYNWNSETYMLVGDALGRAMIDLLDGAPTPGN